MDIEPRSEPAPEQQPPPPPNVPDDGRAVAPVGWEWWDAVLLFIAWQVVLGIILVAGAAIFGDLETEEALGPALAAQNGSLVVLTLVWVAARSRRGIGTLLGPRLPTLADVGAGIGHGVAGVVGITVGLGSLLQLLAGLFDRELPHVQETLQDSTRASGIASFTILAIVVLAPLAEELFFRGMLFQALHKRMPLWPAIGLSSIAFGISHVEPVVVVLTFAFGLYLAWVFRRRGSLVAPIVAHMIFNLAGVILIRLDVPL